MEFIAKLILCLTLIDLLSGQLYEKFVDWNRHANGLYAEKVARADFGSVTGWKSDRVMIENGTLRLTLLKNALFEGGLVSQTWLPNGTAYELSFDVMFDKDFDWSQGGKVGFGFGVGEGNTGCKLPTNGEGGSLRIMWFNNKGEVYFIPYLYHYGMPGPCGDAFGLRYPTTGSLQKSKWYRFQLYMKSNTGNLTNGHARIVIDNETVMDQNIRWTTDDTKRWINKMYFATFRGGSQTFWQSSVDSYIYYDNLSVRQLS